MGDTGRSYSSGGEGAEKAPDAFRTISEVAQELELPQHVLRFWETRFSQIKPLKRGGGRRYYRPQDVDLLRGIRHFLYGEGYTIRGVQRILREQGPRFVVTASQGETTPLPTDDESVTPSVETEEASAQRMAERLAGSRPAPEDTPRLEAGSLSPSDAKRLEATLSELLEMKRLLDAAR